MMEYFEGIMNWPLNPDWVCETCGSKQGNLGLTWGLIHSQCRCNTCHTIYWMRNDKQEIVDIPINGFKDEYKLPAKIGWKLFNHTPTSEWLDDMWDKAIEESKKEQQ